MWQNIYYNISCSVESCSRSLTIGHSSFWATRLHISHWAGPLCRVAGETRSRDWPGPLDGVGQPLLVHLGWDLMSSLDQMRRHKYLRLPHPVGPCNRPAKYNLMDSVSVFVDNNLISTIWIYFASPRLTCILVLSPEVANHPAKHRGLIKMRLITTLLMTTMRSNLPQPSSLPPLLLKGSFSSSSSL